MVYDCFLFFNELDLLELRLRTLDDYVDHFVLVESPWTFSGHPKPLHYLKNAERFSQWAPKIRHIIQPERMETENPWKREYAARNVMPRGFEDAGPDDFIFQSDCDEIWNPKYRDEFPDEPIVTYAMFHFFYRLNMLRPQFLWYGTRRTRRKRWITGQALRTSQGELLEMSGWHFSFLGDAEQAASKLKAFSHTEYSGPEWTNLETLNGAIATGKDLFSDSVRYEPIAIDAGFPKPLLDDPERWAHLIRPVEV